MVGVTVAVLGFGGANRQGSRGMQCKQCRLWTCLGCLLICGCSSVGHRDSTSSNYEATRRQLAHEARGGGVRHVSYDEPSDDELSWEDLTPENFGPTVKRLVGNGPNPEAAKQAYAEAESLYNTAVQSRQQQSQANQSQPFVLAAEQYRKAANLWPNSTLEHDALFMLGESLFFADQYPDAEDAYEELLKKYPNSKHIDYVQPRRYAIATYWLSADDADQQRFHEFNLTDGTFPMRDRFGEAVRVLDRVRLDDPTGKAADDATMALGNAFFRREQFVRADEYYTDLRKTFPSSEHQFRAHFLGLKAKLMSYQGPDYSANPLNAAEKLVKQIRRQFPAESQAESVYLDRAAAEVRFKKARREWKLAEHHDRRSEYGAAKFYYRILLKDYADTPLAKKAEQRMREINGLPDVPPQRLSWLVDLFPEDDSDIPMIASDPQQHVR